MAISLVAVGDKIKAGLVNAIIKQVNLTALAGIVPASVNGTGVTATGNGVVTFTGANTVSLNGVFTGTYDNYRITWNTSGRSLNTSAGFRLRGAGTDLSSTTYDYVRGYDQASVRNVGSSSSNNAIPLDIGVAAGQTSNGVLDLFGPALNTATTGTAQVAVLASSAVTSIQVSFANESTSPYDGFSIYPTTGGTWSGTVRVYGYNNLT